MGRKTWDASVRNFSPEELEKARKMHAGMTTYVFSRTRPAGPIVDGIVTVNSDVSDFVRELKLKPGKDIMIMGGGSLAKGLFESGLIDEVGFNIHPVLLGSGIPLFHEMARQIDLELIQARPFENGCVYVSYRVKNPVQ